MADKKTVGHAYNVDFLNVIFAASSLFLFATTVWMVWDDYDREWKNYQRRFVQLETEVTRAGFEEAEQDVDRQRLDQLTAHEGVGRRQECASLCPLHRGANEAVLRMLNEICTLTTFPASSSASRTARGA